MAGEVRYYSVEEAARVLRLTPERVLEMLEAGELDGIPTGRATWRITIDGDPDVPPPVTAVPTEPPTGDSEAREVPEEPGEPGVPPATLEEARQPAELFHGDHVATNREPTSESGWVSTQQAAKALGISARTVRWHIERGNLEAIPEGEGVERTWRVSVDSLQAYRDSRQAAAPSPRGNRASEIGSDIAAESPGNAIRELADRLVEEARRAEAARVRLELSERAQSTLEAELADERRRREEAERTAEDLRRELDEWRRLEESAETTAHEIHDRRGEERVAQLEEEI
ncbi:MAG TPA: helix-turn-helix domain-containing protein, partial [Rubrobacteraceae bacterium]|nr:helix-turn-helix domain-containing protein [Rubrobacteraceae bacterium]